ncbi:hypothetical protein [Marinifilum flexuosum]|uniref:hypothetical protein n=1 Tax=Marinifilum flexuosum TaxID=1117708 RepID=UPI00249164CB|nr:hypothetical protein [Marinifilum flexuosum]
MDILIGITQGDDGWFYQNLASLIGTFIATIGFVIAIEQLRRNAKTLEGDLALKLDDKISQHRDVYRELFEGGKYYDTIPSNQIEKIEFYLTFFDTASFLVQNKQIKIDQINSLYGYRLMCLMHNKNIQQIILTKSKSWSNLLWLYDRIISCREKCGQEIPRKENKLINHE